MSESQEYWASLNLAGDSAQDFQSMEQVNQSEIVELAPAQQDLIGSTLDEKYEILELIGKGASGVVLKARHLVLDQFIAIKIFAPILLESENSRERFKQEATILSSLSHLNIVKFQAFGIFDSDKHYMALEYLKGKTLAEILKSRGPLHENKALPIFIQICNGLVYIHEKGIVHRDIKPGNVMIIEDEEPVSAKILDFGIFKQLDQSNQKLTKTGALLGSANYMSPEQCLAAPVDKSSDFYSFGCLMYETLTGKPPMEAENDLLTMARHTNPDDRVESLPAKYPTSKILEKIIVKCLSKKSEERFSDAEELLKELNQALSAPKQQNRNKVQFSRNQVIMYLSMAIFLLGLAGIVVFMQSKQVNPDAEVSPKFKARQEQNKYPKLSSNQLKSLDEIEKWLDTKKQTPADSATNGLELVLDDYLRSVLGINSFQPKEESITRILKNHQANGGEYTDLEHAQHYYVKTLHRLKYYSALMVFENQDSVANDAIMKKMGGTAPKIDSYKPSKDADRRKEVALALFLMSDFYWWRHADFDKALACLGIANKMLDQDNENEAFLRATTFIKSGILWNTRVIYFEQGKKDLLKGLRYAERALSSGNLDNSVPIVEMCRNLNDSGEFEAVRRFIEKNALNDIKNHPPLLEKSTMAELQAELARAYLLLGKTNDAETTLSKAIVACHPDMEASAALESQLQMVLHAEGKSEYMKKVLEDYLHYTNKNMGFNKYLEVQIPILCAYARNGVNAIQRWSKLNEELCARETECLTSIDPDVFESITDCAELRLIQAYATTNPEAALKLCQIAADDCLLRITPRSSYLLQAIRLRQVNLAKDAGQLVKAQAYFQQGKNEFFDAQIGKLKGGIKQSQKLPIAVGPRGIPVHGGSAPLFFALRRSNAMIHIKFGNIEAAKKELEVLLNEHEDVPVLINHFYLPCAVDYINLLLGEVQKKGASAVKEKSLELLEKISNEMTSNRSSYLQENYELNKLLCVLFERIHDAERRKQCHEAVLRWEERIKKYPPLRFKRFPPYCHWNEAEFSCR